MHTLTCVAACDSECESIWVRSISHDAYDECQYTYTNHKPVESCKSDALAPQCSFPGMHTHKHKHLCSRTHARLTEMNYSIFDTAIPLIHDICFRAIHTIYSIIIGGDSERNEFGLWTFRMRLVPMHATHRSAFNRFTMIVSYFWLLTRILASCVSSIFVLWCYQLSL